MDAGGPGETEDYTVTVVAPAPPAPDLNEPWDDDDGDFTNGTPHLDLGSRVGQAVFLGSVEVVGVLKGNYGAWEKELMPLHEKEKVEWCSDHFNEPKHMFR